MSSRLLARLTALLAPPSCAGCRGPLAPGRWVCERCRSRLQRLPQPPARGRTAAAYPYRDVARRLVLELKFSGAVRLADELAELMLQRIEPPAASELIVPVPAHPARLRRRGYNQAALLARALAGHCGAEVVDCLRHAPGGRPQSELSRAQRMTAAAAAIRLAPHGLTAPQTNVVVCDDVTTTGCTLEACVQAIRSGELEAGHRPLRAVVFAAA